MKKCCQRCDVGLPCIFDDDGPNLGPAGSHGTHARAEETSRRPPHDSSGESDD